MWVLCSDRDLRESLSELLEIDGSVVTHNPVTPAAHLPAVVLAACDAWPPGWDLAVLRKHFRRVPCLLLSGSLLAGDFAVTRFERGYFVQLPAAPGRILELVGELTGA